MKKCKKCGKEFNPTKGLINYCSISCRNTRIHSEETKQKISNSVKNSEKCQSVLKKIQISKEIREKIKKTRKKNDKKRILSADFDTLSFDGLKKRIFYEQDEKCNQCGIKDWNGKPLSFGLEHKDGNHHNNKRDNLEILCPNCHSQTKYWRGRNKPSNVKKVNDDELLETLLKHNWNMRQSLIEVGLSPKGGNYKRCHKLKREVELLKK